MYHDEIKEIFIFLKNQETQSMPVKQFQGVCGCNKYFSDLLLCGLINNKILKLDEHIIVLDKRGEDVLNEDENSFNQRNFYKLLQSEMIDNNDNCTVECPGCHATFKNNVLSEDSFSRIAEENHCRVCLRLILNLEDYSKKN